MPRLLVLVALLCLSASAASGQGVLSVDDYFTQVGIAHSLLSPDGKTVAYVETRWDKDANDRQAELCVAALAGGAPRRLLPVRLLQPGQLRWSADGLTLYFSARRQRRDDRPPLTTAVQLWRVPARGGEAEPLTRSPSDVQGFAVSPDGRTIYYRTDAEEPDLEWRELKEKFKGQVEHGHGPRRVSQLWRQELPDGKPEKLLDDKRYVQEMELSPDGRRLALITAPDDRVLSAEGQSRVDVCEVNTGKLTILPERPYRRDVASPFGWLERLAWAPDAKAVAFNVIFDGYPAELFVGDMAQSPARVFKVERPDGLSVHGYGSPLQWRGTQELCFLGEERARVRLCCATGVRGDKPGLLRVLTPGDVVVEQFSLSANGEQAAMVLNDTTHLPDLFVLEGQGKPRRLLRLNPQADNWKLPQYQIFTWKGAGGVTVEGVLELPPDYRKGQKVPLVVEIHGGPTSASYYNVQFAYHGRTLLPARGYAVLSPNYRGSTGYGDKFLTDLLGRENDVDVEDILKGVEALIEAGIADKERLGVMGWSNGGYLTNCLLTKTTQFKAASSGASIVDCVQEWGTNDEPAYVISLKQGFPWNRREAYRRTSPSYDLDRIRTPTLIHVGSNDERCPPGHSRMLYRALKEYLKVPTELLVYKGEGHGLARASSRRAKMEWDLAWFDRYILGKSR